MRGKPAAGPNCEGADLLAEASATCNPREEHRESDNVVCPR